MKVPSEFKKQFLTINFLGLIYHSIVMYRVTLDSSEVLASDASRPFGRYNVY